MEAFLENDETKIVSSFTTKRSELLWVKQSKIKNKSQKEKHLVLRTGRMDITNKRGWLLATLLLFFSNSYK